MKGVWGASGGCLERSVSSSWKVTISLVRSVIVTLGWLAYGIAAASEIAKKIRLVSIGKTSTDC